MCEALGIISFAGNHIWVEGLHDYRPVAAFSFLGRYRVVDFPISNMSNSGMDHIQVYLNAKPRSLIEHLGSGRHYNINSKRGKLHMLFADSMIDHDMYNNDISAYMENLESITYAKEPYVIVAPSYMVYTQDFSALLNTHIESGADVTLLYQSVDNAKDAYVNCDILNLNKQKGVLSIEKNRGNAKNRNIFMDTYVMKKELFIDLIKKAKKTSSLYTLSDIISSECGENGALDVRGASHRGYFAAITDFKGYYNANIALTDYNAAFFNDTATTEIYTRTNDSSPTHYSEEGNAKNSVISNGCLIEGTVDNSVIGRGCTIKEGAIVKNCVILSDVVIGAGVHAENLVIDRNAKLTKVKEVVANEGDPHYVKRYDVI